MTKEKLKQEAGNWLRKYLLCYNCEKKCNCIDSNSYCEEQVLKAYVDSAEPREKRIAELEKENAELKEKLKPENCLKLLAKEGYVKFTSDQLTKAKEIIKIFLKYEICTLNIKDELADNIAKAKSFLKSEVKK